jgi:HEAT repeat protein
VTDPTSGPDTVDGPDASPTDAELGGTVEETITSLLKAARARQTYVPGNPLIERFQGELSDRLRSLWEEISHLTLTVDEGRFLWREQEVYSKPVGPDNLAFRFFKDGIRLLAFLPGVEQEEMADFLDLVTSTRRSQDEDLLALLWHRDFDSVRIEYVDVAEDEALEVPSPDRGSGAGESLEDLSEIEAVLESGSVTEEDTAEFADVALGEPDLLYLKRQMEAEWNRSLVHDVTLSLLDQFEMRDQERRRQVVDILREFLPRLLTESDFASVALIVNELQLLANKTGEDETQELVTALLRDMSEAMAELISAPLDSGDTPAEEEMAALLDALQAEAIPTLVRAIPAVPNRTTRERLTEALERLVGRYPDQVVDLLSAEDPMLAAEAARIVGRLGLQEAEPQLVELARRPEEVTRQAAIEALARMGSGAGADALTDALADPGREIRLAAVGAIAAVRPPGAASVLESWIVRSEMAGRDQGEQLAFLRAYALLAGERATPLLTKFLTGRKWWGGRMAPSLRACAAQALAVVATPEARAVLEKAVSDRAAVVKSAVRVALRTIDADPDAELLIDEADAEESARRTPGEVEGTDLVYDLDEPLDTEPGE